MNRMIMTSCLLYLFFIAGTLMAPKTAGPQFQWPVGPTDVDHPIMTVFGELIEEGGRAYLHNGIDIMGDCGPDGPWVRSVSNGSGFISWNFSDLTNTNQFIMVADGETVYWYQHLDLRDVTERAVNYILDEIAVSIDLELGKIAEWDPNSFNHLHFAIAHHQTNWVNPLNNLATGGLTPEQDDVPPRIDEILLYENNCERANPRFYEKPASGCWTVSGDLDIIARASDSNPPLPTVPWHGNTGIYRIEFSIQKLHDSGIGNIPDTTLGSYMFDSFSFIDSSDEEEYVYAIYSNAAKCNADSTSEYGVEGGERYYYILTNIDGDGNLDKSGHWDTDGGEFPNGLYQINITAYDIGGNYHSRSEIVFVQNDGNDPNSQLPVEVFIKDREGDRGTIPSNPNGEAFWLSPDIRVDAPPFEQVNATGQPFGSSDHENPIYDTENRVHVRVHNLGCKISEQVKIKLYWADPAGGIPKSAWHEIRRPGVDESVNGIPAGGSVEYGPIPWTPSGDATGHKCLLVRLESDQDPIEETNYNVPSENNIAMKNINIVSPIPGEQISSQFFITNPSESSGSNEEKADVQITIDRSEYPELAQVKVELPYDIQMLESLEETEDVEVEYSEGALMEIAIISDTVTLPGFSLSQEEKIPAGIKLILPEQMDFSKRYTLDIIQRVNGFVSGGLTFVVPGRCER